MNRRVFLKECFCHFYKIIWKVPLNLRLIEGDWDYTIILIHKLDAVTSISISRCQNEIFPVNMQRFASESPDSLIIAEASVYLIVFPLTSSPKALADFSWRRKFIR